MNRRMLGGSAAVAAALLFVGACGGSSGGDDSDKSEVVIGVTGSRVGPIANVGEGIGGAIVDWFDMVNAEGGINGRQVKVVEVETQYQVPLGIEAFARFQQQKAALVVAEGTALADALTPVSQKAEIPLIFPGQGNLKTVDGKALPYAFPAGPLYAHQASSLVDYIAKTDAEATIACLAWEAPPGKEFCAGAKSAAEENGTSFLGEVGYGAKAVDLTTPVNKLVDLGATVNLHSGVFGQATLAYKGLCSAAPDAGIGTWHWGITKDAITDAGADCLEGVVGTSMSTLVSDEPEAVKKLQDYWKSEGKDPNPVLESNTVYSNGLYFAVLIEEAIRQADDASDGGDLTGADLKAGLESIKDFDGYGVACPITLTEKDHSGNRAVNIYEVQSGEFVQKERCLTGPPVEGEPDVQD